MSEKVTPLKEPAWIREIMDKYPPVSPAPLARYCQMCGTSIEVEHDPGGPISEVCYCEQCRPKYLEFVEWSNGLPYIQQSDHWYVEQANKCRPELHKVVFKYDHVTGKTWDELKEES